MRNKLKKSWIVGKEMKIQYNERVYLYKKKREKIYKKRNIQQDLKVVDVPLFGDVAVH